MTETIARLPDLGLRAARRITAAPDRHPDADVLDACEVLIARGDCVDVTRGQELRRAIANTAAAELNRAARRRAIRLALIALGAAFVAGIVSAATLFNLIGT